MAQDSDRAAKCHDFIAQLSGTAEGGPAVQ
jgi:hypothetical protein